MWTAKSALPLPSAGRCTAVAFSIGSKGYLGTGITASGIAMDDFWEYDPITDIWTQKANFGGGPRCFAIGFSISNKGYIGTGVDAASVKQSDFWEYDPVANAWTQAANNPGVPRGGACAFSIAGFGFMGTGGDAAGVSLQDFWKYDPVANTWSGISDYPGGARQDVDHACFIIGSKAYCGTGFDASFTKTKDFWEYDPATDLWIQKADFPPNGRIGATGFTLCGKGFLGLGSQGVYENDMWMYDPATNTWTSQAPLPAPGRVDQPAFVINNRAYIGTGLLYNGNYVADLWEFSLGTGTSINAVASNTVLCPGNSATLTVSGGNNYLWNTGNSSSVIIVNPAATATYYVIGMDVCGRDTAFVTVNVSSAIVMNYTVTPVICSGNNSGAAEVNVSGGVAPYTCLWSNSQTTFSVSGLNAGSYTVTATDAFGCSSTQALNVTQPAAFSVSAGALPECGNNKGISYVLAAGGTSPYTYLWNTSSQSSSAATGLPAGMYTCTVTDANGCTQIAGTAVPSFGPPAADAGVDVTIVSGSSANLSATGGVTYDWMPSSGLNCFNCQDPLATPTATTTYTVIVTDGNGCTASDTVIVFVRPDNCKSPNIFFIPNAFSPNEDGDNDKMCLQGFADCIEKFNIYIFDRWGEKVFESEDKLFCWDGTSHGKPEETAMFGYYLTCILKDGTTIRKKGNVSLLR